MKIFDFLKRSHDECIKHSEHIVFDKKYPRHLYLVGLYGTLIELTGSLITLIDNKHRTGVSPIFRSILEAYVEVRNLHADEKYVYFMDASYHEQWLKVFKEAKNTSNLFLKDISEIKNLGGQIQEHEKSIEDLNNKGYKSLKFFSVLKKLGWLTNTGHFTIF